MDPQNKHLTCHLCEKKFSKLSNKNRHLKKIHNKEPLEGRSTKYVKCPLCSEEKKVSLENHDCLIKHLEQIHSLTIQISSHHFKSKDEFEAWRCMSYRNTDYTCGRSAKTHKDEEYIYYNCNRSNTVGFVSQCRQRRMKKGGSIKISGLCPSRITVKIKSSGVDVKHIETHVGHDDRLRSKHSSQNRQEMIGNSCQSRVNGEAYTKGPEGFETSLRTDEPSTGKAQNRMKVKNFTEKATKSQNIGIFIHPDRNRENVLNEIKLKLNSMDDEHFYKMIDLLNQEYNNMQAEKNSGKNKS